MYLFKVIDGKTRTLHEICLKLKIKTLEQQIRLHKQNN